MKKLILCITALLSSFLITQPVYAGGIGRGIGRAIGKAVGNSLGADGTMIIGFILLHFLIGFIASCIFVLLIKITKNTRFSYMILANFESIGDLFGDLFGLSFSSVLSYLLCFIMLAFSGVPVIVLFWLPTIISIGVVIKLSKISFVSDRKNNYCFIIPIYALLFTMPPVSFLIFF